MLIIVEDWMPSSSCEIQLFKKPSYKDVITGKIDAFTLKDAQYEMIVAHEFGHALGMKHHNDPKALMYPMLEEQDMQHFRLQSADIALFNAR